MNEKQKNIFLKVRKTVIKTLWYGIQTAGFTGFIAAAVFLFQIHQNLQDHKKANKELITRIEKAEKEIANKIKDQGELNEKQQENLGRQLTAQWGIIKELSEKTNQMHYFQEKLTIPFVLMHMGMSKQEFKKEPELEEEVRRRPLPQLKPKSPGPVLIEPEEKKNKKLREVQQKEIEQFKQDQMRKY